MNNVKICLCLVVVVLTVNFIECRGGGHGGGGHGGGSHGGSHGGGHSYGGHSYGGHSSGSHSTSHSSGGWFSGWFGGRSSSSGSSSSHTYPGSKGYSGHGTGGSHTYPHSPGLSGYAPSRPTYYTAPQHIYVTQYREAPQSPYSNLLTGLTMYNLGRSHHYNDHYYSDDYHRSSGGYYSGQHTNTGSSNYNTEDSKDEAKCVLKIKKNEKVEVLKIPCAIVSTFDSGNKSSNAFQETMTNNCSSLVNMNKTLDNNATIVNGTNLNNYTSTSNTVTSPCVDIADPLAVTGAPIASADAINMECSVEIRTKTVVIQNNVDCATLLKYANMAVPQDKSTNVLPSRQTLKSMLDKPPWWMSLLIAV